MSIPLLVLGLWPHGRLALDLHAVLAWGKSKRPALYLSPGLARGVSRRLALSLSAGRDQGWRPQGRVLRLHAVLGRIQLPGSKGIGSRL